MPKQVQRAEVNSFLGGLITEASPLNFPPNAASDIVNFELQRTGLINRRLGMDFEQGFAYKDTGYAASQIDNLGRFTFKWELVGGDPNTNFIVFQIGNSLFLYNADVINFTGSNFVGRVDISSFPSTKDWSIADVEGRMVVVCGNPEIAIVEYKNSAFTVSYQRILTRDLWGMEETSIPDYETDPSYRNGVFAPEHVYNLYNQSWGIPRKDSTGTQLDPVVYYRDNLGVYPSNSEEVWAGLSEQAVATGQQPFERMYANLYQELLGAKIAGAKGYFIIDALDRGTSRYSQFYVNRSQYAELTQDISYRQDSTDGGATCVAEFAGRFFYGGFSGTLLGGDARSPNLSNYIFYSQLIQSAGDIVKCYQDGDPTSRDTSDVVDTDGGFIRVSGAKEIIAMRPLGSNLIIFASNGVWLLTGGTVDSGFTATNYKVSQLSTYNIVSLNSLIVEGDVAFFWSNDGIYQVGKDQLGDYKVDSITLKTLQTFYLNIPNAAKYTSFGQYDEINKKLRWVWIEGDSFDPSQVMHELVLDSYLNAFSHNIIQNTTDFSVLVGGMFQTQALGTETVDLDVTANSVLVTVGGVQVQVPSTQQTSNTQFVRYLVLANVNGTLNLTVAYYYQEDWLDWYSYDNTGVDAKAYLQTG